MALPGEVVAPGGAEEAGDAGEHELHAPNLRGAVKRAEARGVRQGLPDAAGHRDGEVRPRRCRPRDAA